MRACEPSLASFTVSGCQTDALVSDYSSKSKSSTGEGRVLLFGVSNLSTYHWSCAVAVARPTASVS